jgi:spore coat protein U-like protein
LIWGDGSASTNTVAGIGIGSNQSLTAYGQIPAAEAGAVGTFNDTVVATVTF